MIGWKVILKLVRRFWPVFAAVAVIGATWWAIQSYGQQRFEAGRQNVISADAKATEDLHKRVAKLTAQKAALAAAAKARYDDDHAQTLASAAAPVGTRELCKPAPDHRSVGVPAAGGAHPGDEATPAAASVVQPVREANSGFAYDRSRLLGAAFALADEQTGVIREFQARE